MDKFDRRKAEKELDSFLSQIEVIIDEKKYPQLNEMAKRGNEHNWKDYFLTQGVEV